MPSAIELLRMAYDALYFSMGCDRDVNAYYWPEYQKVESGAWQFQNYDTNGGFKDSSYFIQNFYRKVGSQLHALEYACLKFI